MCRHRLLVAMFQGGGNVPLLLPIVTRLVTRGHRVRFMVGPGVRASRLPISEHLYRSLRSTGADVIRLRVPDIHPLDAARGARGVALGWVPAAFRTVSAEARVACWIPHWAQEVASELRREQADAVVADFILVGALVAAEAAGIPSVALVHNVYRGPVRRRPPWGPGWLPTVSIVGRLRDAAGTLASNRIQARDALPFLNRARRSLGLRPVRRYFEQDARASRIVVLTSPEFDSPEGFPANVRLVGTPLGDTAPLSAFPTWSMDDGRPLVLVSLSTLEQGQAMLMQRILAALASLPVRALVTVGPALDPSRFTPPGNVVLETFVPHRSVLPHAAAIVSQCGLGTVMKALAHGVPLVCVPLVGDQPENAARVQGLGAGVRLPSDAGPSHIRGAIEQVLTDPAFRLAAQCIAKAIAGQDPVQAAVDEIESVLRPV
jgi:MGT family glycosyltransferase